VFQMSNTIKSGAKTEDHLQLVYSDGVLFGELLFSFVGFSTAAYAIII